MCNGSAYRASFASGLSVNLEIDLPGACIRTPCVLRYHLRPAQTPYDIAATRMDMLRLGELPPSPQHATLLVICEGAHVISG